MNEMDGSQPEYRHRAGHDPTGGVQLLGMISPAGPWAIRVAATLRLADLMRSGIFRGEDLAVAAGVDADALRRLLRYLTCRGIFSEPMPDRFEPNAASRLLEDRHPAKLRAWLDLEGAGGRMDEVWSRLLDAVRFGQPVYAQLFGCSLWEDLDANPGLANSFASLMAANSSRTARDVATVYDWATVRHVVDVGGGTGSLLAEILSSHPAVRGTLVDLPATVSLAVRCLAAAGIEERCTAVAGSFFDPLPRGADVYVLANVLHDWGDREAVKILRSCADAGGENGRVLIVERVLGRGGDKDATEHDLRVLVLFGGKVRTLDQFRRLAADSGMNIRTTRSMPSGISLLECNIGPG